MGSDLGDLPDHLWGQGQHPLKQALMHLHRAGIFQGAMCFAHGHRQQGSQRAKRVTVGIRHHDCSQIVGVQRWVFLKEATPTKESKVEADLMAKDGVVSDELPQLRSHLGETRGVGQHGILNASQLSDERRERTARIDQRLILGLDAGAGEADRADFDDRIPRRV